MMHAKPWAYPLLLAGLLASFHSGAAPLPGSKPLPSANAPLRAQLVATRYAVLTSEMVGRVSNLPVKEGQRFAAGAALVSYDCALNRARLERAVQAESAARKKQDTAEQLDALKSISRADLEQARSAVSVAKAESGVERVMVRRCTVSAPFPGRVGEVFVRANETVAEGKELLSIYDDSAFDVQAIVPSRWLAWLKPGYPMKVTLDETGQTHLATVLRVAGSVDPVSQSVRITGRLTNKTGGTMLLHGMSGTVRIDPPATQAGQR